ncbi:MAG: 16S rRNA (cytosine(967)-C(5))-methyltransferase RsmB [Oscillospiraceae bacterium]
MDNRRYWAVKAVIEAEKGGYSQLVADSVLKECNLEEQERRFVSALFYGVCERHETLVRVLQMYNSKKMDTAVRAILLTGIYQLLYMKTIPPSAAVNESVKLCKEFKKTSAGSFVNGILRSFIRDGLKLPQGKNETDELALEFSCSYDVAEAFTRWLGRDGAKSALESALGMPPIFIRVNTLKTHWVDLIAALKKEGIQAEETDIEGCLKAYGNVAHNRAFKAGFFTVQDKLSQIAALSLPVKAGDRVLDICAAPGGKAFLLAQKMENKGSITCSDISLGRLALVEETAKRLGISIIKLLENDGRVFSEELAAEKFDAILCDVPCSGLGVIRRKPELKYRTEEEFNRFSVLQYEILENASKYLKVGGTIVYSTCTLNPAENEENIKRFLTNHENYVEKPFENGEFIIKNPIGNMGGDGFFIARMEKKA